LPTHRQRFKKIKNTPPAEKNKILCLPAFGTFGFARHTKPTLGKPKEPLFSNTFNDDLKEVKNFFQENIVT